MDILRDGRADVGLLYAPYDDLDGLAHETLYVEDRVVIVPAGHTSVRMSDLEGETLPRGKGIPQGDGTGPEVTAVVQMLQMITVSRMIGVLPRSLAAPVPAGLVCVPVADAPPSRLVLAWNEQDRRPLVTSFVTAALEAVAAQSARVREISEESRQEPARQIAVAGLLTGGFRASFRGGRVPYADL
nr:LysR substrate-binding domain-containing protein [Streptomyces sp. GMR22]